MWLLKENEESISIIMAWRICMATEGEQVTFY